MDYNSNPLGHFLTLHAVISRLLASGSADAAVAQWSVCLTASLVHELREREIG